MSEGSMDGTVGVNFAALSGARYAEVVVDRPAKLNALTPEQVARLVECFLALADDKDLRAVVLTGAGERAFIGGADLNALRSFDPESARAYITSLHHACSAIRALPVPVIGRINGHCLGAGLEVAAACDLRIAVDSATFGMPEVKVGLPSVIEAALLPGLVGWGRTRQLVFTGDSVGAAEALSMGLVERVVPAGALDDAVGAWLGAVCEAGPQAIRLQKALIAKWEALPLEAGIEAGIEALADAYRTDEPQRLIDAFLARRGAAPGPRGQ